MSEVYRKAEPQKQERDWRLLRRLDNVGQMRVKVSPAGAALGGGSPRKHVANNTPVDGEP
jgi:hypothetical protein